MDERKSGEKEFREGLPDSSQNDYRRRREAAKKTVQIMDSFSDSNEDAICGERLASFLVTADFTRDGDPKRFNKEAFQPSRPILWTRGKHKTGDGKNQSCQNKAYYSDMVARRTRNDLPGAKNDGGFVPRTKTQRSILQQSSASEANNTEQSSKEECSVEKKKAISHKRCFESLDATTSKDEKHSTNFSCSERALIPRMKSEREDISSVEKKRSKDVKATSPEEWKCCHHENQDKGHHFKTTTVPKKEKFNVATETKKKNISGSKAVEKECKDSERSLQVKSAKVRGTAKDPGGKKVVKAASSNVGKDEFKSKSENHINAAFTGQLPGRIPGTYSLIDIEKLKQKHAMCCRECLEARARSARPVRKDSKQEDSKKMMCRKPSAPGIVDNSSEEQLEGSIVFFRNALNAVDLLERLFHNIGSTKEFLQHIYDGLEESSDVARCRRNMADGRRGDEGAMQPKNVPKNESKEKVTSESHDDESKKAIGKSKKKDHSKIKFKSSGAAGQSSDITSMKQDQKSKSKRDRNKNLLELSDEWKKRNNNVKP